MNNYIELTGNGSDTALIKVYDGIKHTEITEEFILPDYLPDVKRIIRVDARPKIDGKFITAGKVEYEGDVVCTILFCDGENKLKTVTFTAPFSDVVELSDNDDECIANLIPSPESISCRMINPRRASLRLRIDTAVTVWCGRSFSPELTGAYSEESAEVKTRDVDVMKLICAGESGLNASADLEVDGALMQVGEVISCNVDMSFYECKGAEDKVLCRGEMPITVFYSTPEGEGENYTVLFRKLPIAQVVSAEGVTEAYECMAKGSVDGVKVSVAENGFGERRIIELDVSYRIYLNCVSRDKVTVTEDIYVPGADVVTETEKKELCSLARTYSKSFGASASFTREELDLNDAENVFEVSSEPRINDVRLTDGGYKLTVSGTAPTSAIIKRADGLFSVEYAVPFSAELDGEGIPKDFTYNSDTVCMCAKGRLDNERLYTELELQMDLMVLGVNGTEVLKRAEFTARAEESEKPQMRFFYPSETETLWSIGKRFGISQGELLKVNKIEGEKMPDMLIIPTK